MKKLFIIGLMFLFTNISTQEEIPESTQTEVKTVTANGFTFVYGIDGENLKASLSFKTSGWVSVGFNPSKAMKDANIIIGYAHPENPLISDHFGSGTYKHQADTLIGGKDNIISGSCTEKDGVTTLSFTIPLDSGDRRDTVLKKESKVKVIFAAGKDKDLKKKHVKRARTEIVL